MRKSARVEEKEINEEKNNNQGHNQNALAHRLKERMKERGRERDLQTTVHTSWRKKERQREMRKQGGREKLQNRQDKGHGCVLVPMLNRFYLLIQYTQTCTRHRKLVTK